MPESDVRAIVEVTNTLVVPYVSGIQRTVREVLAHWPADCGVEVVPVVHTGTVFRRLLPAEVAVLAGEPAGPPPEPESGGWRAVARKVPGLGAGRDWLRAQGNRRRDARFARDGLVVEPAAGDVLFDLEATWWSPADRAELLPALRDRGVAVATLVYDLMPLADPAWFDPDNRAAFVPWAEAQLTHADLAIVFSRFCAEEVARFGDPIARAAGRPLPPPTARFVPGADATGPPGRTGPGGVDPGRPASLPDDGVPYVLSVGTIEPRKNHRVLLDAFDALWAGGLDARLVLVGRRGWEVDDLVDRLVTHPERGRRLVWTGYASDDEVDRLYRHAAAVAVPSWCEGYGLPVVEGLRRGAPVVASTGGALAEVGGDAVTYAAPDDPAAWLEAIVHHVASPPDEAERAAALATPAVQATWAEAARTIAGHLTDLAERHRP